MLMAAAALMMGGVAMAQDFSDGARERRFGQGQMQRGEMQQRRQQGERGQIDRRKMEGERFERMAKMLRLDERQKREVRRIEADYRGRIGKLHSDKKGDRKAIRKAMKREKSVYRKEMKRVLNSDQFARWEQMEQRRQQGPARRPEMGMGRAPGGRDAFGMGHRRGTGGGFEQGPNF